MQRHNQNEAQYTSLKHPNQPQIPQSYQDYSRRSDPTPDQYPYHQNDTQFSSFNNAPLSHGQRGYQNVDTSYDPHAVHPQVSPIQSSHDYSHGKAPEITTLPVTNTVHPQRSFISLFKEWRWELFCWFFGSLAFAASIALLIKFHDALLSEWKSKIQATAIIAALAQASTSAFLVPISSSIAQLKWTWFHHMRRAYDLDKFDRASRGPEGALRLLFQLTGRPQLVSLGALATILLLAFPTFMQQSVKVELRQTSHATEQASIDRAMRYKKPETGSLTFAAELYSDAPDIIMAASISAAMLDAYRSLSNVTANCPSDRCTWEPYTSLGICFDTEDITSSVVASTKENATSLSPMEISGQDVVFSEFTKDFTFGSAALFFSDRDPVNEQQKPRPTQNKTDSTFPDIADIFLLYYDPCLGSHNETKSWKAFRANTRLCLQTLNSTFNSSTTTAMIDSKSDLTWKLSNVSFKGTYPIQQWCTEHKSENFCIDRGTLQAMGGQVALIFNNSASLIPGGDDYYETRWSPNLVHDVLGSAPTKCSNETGLGLDGFKKRVQNVAISMTNTMRTSNSTNTIRGTVWLTEQYISVHYIWISYPATIYFILTLFFFATIHATRHDPLWKSSPLALLHAMRPRNGMDSTQEMEREAKSLKVRFERRGAWMLVPEGEGREGIRGG